MTILVAILTAAALLAYAAGVEPGAMVLFGAMSALSAWRHRKEQRERAAFDPGSAAEDACQFGSEPG